jgi:hypothetical protein
MAQRSVNQFVRKLQARFDVLDERDTKHDSVEDVKKKSREIEHTVAKRGKHRYPPSLEVCNLYFHGSRAEASTICEQNWKGSFCSPHESSDIVSSTGQEKSCEVACE